MSGRKLLRAIYADPVRANINWNDLENLIWKLGGEVSYGDGSSVIFVLNGLRAVFHSPHPQKEAPKYAIRRLRTYFEEAGVDTDAL